MRTKRVRYVGPSPSVRLVDGTVAERNATVEIDAELADNLLSSKSWAVGPVKKRSTRKKEHT